MIREAWESYERDVLPTNAGDVQRRECRQAFYAGALSLFDGVMKAATAEDIHTMERISEELRDYVRSLR